MSTRNDHRRAFLQFLLAACAVPVRGFARQDTAGLDNGVSFDAKTASYHVYPKGRIQNALEAAARDPVNKTVYVHAGTYRPPAKGQALIWFNARHDGITLQAVVEADARAPSYPAVVNHVVYFGDGVSRKTVLRGFKITGANNFTTGSGERSPIESDEIRKTPLEPRGVPQIVRDEADPRLRAEKNGRRHGGANEEQRRGHSCVRPHGAGSLTTRIWFAATSVSNCRRPLGHRISSR